MSKIAAIRKDYRLQSLLEADIEASPIKQFGNWWQEALNSEIEEINAMTLATAGINAVPSARIVLLKDFSEKGFVFFTNYKSDKGAALAENPVACLVFYWKELERQVRITGKVEQTSATESDDYFSSRPEGSQIGAWASPQSTIIENREVIELNEALFKEKFNKNKIPRPAHWGGYIVLPTEIEFWQGRPNRLHDRVKYSLQKTGIWKIKRLAP